MSRVNRYDFSAASELGAPVETPEGFLRVDGRISRIGIQIYHLADGSVRRELRLPEEVQDAESLASFEGVPLTNDHPDARVDARSAKRVMVGSVGHPQPDGDYVRARIVIIDEDAIKQARGGRRQLSCGYSCEVDETQVPEYVIKYGQYDSIQRKIRGNHVALVDRARAGNGATIRLDSGDGVAEICQEKPMPVASSQETPMPFKLTVGKHTYEVADANIQATVDEAIGAEKQRADKADATLAEVQKQLSGLEAERDALSARVDAKDQMKCDECSGKGKMDGEECPNCKGEGMVDKKTDSYERRLESRERSVARGAAKIAALLDQARSVLGPQAKLDGVSELEIKRLVVRKHWSRNSAILARLDGDKKLDAAYIQPLFDAALGETQILHAPQEQSTAIPVVTQQNDEDPESAYTRMNRRLIESRMKGAQ